MKEKELRTHAQCSACGKKIGNSGILFWKLTIERFMVNLPAIQRQDGLAAVLGGRSFLAQAMGPDEDVAAAVMEPTTVTICEVCAVSKLCVAQLVEQASMETISK